MWSATAWMRILLQLPGCSTSVVSTRCGNSLVVAGNVFVFVDAFVIQSRIVKSADLALYPQCTAVVFTDVAWHYSHCLVCTVSTSATHRSIIPVVLSAFWHKLQWLDASKGPGTYNISVIHANPASY